MRHVLFKVARWDPTSHYMLGVYQQGWWSPADIILAKNEEIDTLVVVTLDAAGPSGTVTQVEQQIHGAD